MSKNSKNALLYEKIFLLSYFEYLQFLVKYTYGLAPLEQD
jgi:hypothetical protein